MTTIVKKVKFDAAHLLSGDAGKCGNLHGHGYQVEVEVAGGDDGDMVVDFRELKRVIEEKVLSRLDHAFICCTESPVEREFAAVAERNGMRVCALPYRSTCENIAKYIYGEIAEAGVTAVRVRETEDNSAEYRPERKEAQNA